MSAKFAFKQEHAFGASTIDRARNANAIGCARTRLVHVDRPRG